MQEEEKQDGSLVQPHFDLSDLVCPQCACVHVRKYETQSQPPCTVCSLGSCYPRPQSGCPHLFKKNPTQWWVEPKREVAMGWGREIPGSLLPLPVPRSFTASLCPLPLPPDSVLGQMGGCPCRGEGGVGSTGGGLRLGVDLAVG